MELIYHYIWKHAMAGRHHVTCQGDPLDILSPGRHNDDAGPDFTSARLRIAGRTWGGNVEIHVNASDWYRHHHDRDRAYDNVILHVVARDDARIPAPGGGEVPQVVISVPDGFTSTYEFLRRDLRGIRCATQLPSLPPLAVDDWLETLAVERLHEKAARMTSYYRTLGYSWEQAVFVAMARALGFGLNGVPFELLAKSLPLKYVGRHADDPLQIEALLFGQAGMLDASGEALEADARYVHLRREYRFLRAKYGLKPIDPSLWKYARTRPQNFPHRRIAVLARALYDGRGLSDSLVDAGADPEALASLFGWKLDAYWRGNAAFGLPASKPQPVALSMTSRRLLMVNLAAPFHYARGVCCGDCDAAEAGYDLLAALPPERNACIREWEDIGIEAGSALRSQALLMLRTAYCDAGRCLSCRWGHSLLRRRMESETAPAAGCLRPKHRSELL